MKFAPLHVHSTYSFLDGLSKPSQIAERCKELGYTACGLTDHGVLAGTIPFIKACKEVGIKPIIGCELYIADPTISERFNHHLCVLAKNTEGWKELLRIVNLSNQNFYYKPRVTLEQLEQISPKNLIAFSGHPGSQLANHIFTDCKKIYKCQNEEEVKKLAKQDWSIQVANLATLYQKIFNNNFYLEIQLIDSINLPAARVIASGLRYVSKKTGIKCVCTPDAHYPRQQDAADQRILLASMLKTTLPAIMKRMEEEEDVTLGGFFKSSRYHIPSVEEFLEAGNTEEEIHLAGEISDECETPNILHNPVIPVFDCPNNLSNPEYLTKLCSVGWEAKLKHVSQDKIETYKTRLDYELGVINTVGLAGYFLIVQDYCKYAKDRGWLMSPARGSGGGSLVSYLLNITSLDPLPYNLLFERFYNAGRNTATRVSLPDIDCDFPVEKRDEMVAYLINKYGKERVAQISTFGRLQGRSAFSAVCRAYGDLPFDEVKKITKFIPDEAAISDKLQEMEEPSIIRWALLNNKKHLAEWCSIDEKTGELSGELANKFAQAIRLEGTKISSGRHAAGIIISTEPLDTIVPMVYTDKSGEKIVGMEMNDAEAMGLVKFDILGVAILDKIQGVVSMVRNKSKKK